MLADRKEGYRPKNAAPFYSLIPLSELIAEALQVGSTTKKTQTAYFALLQLLGSELKILIDIPMEEIRHAAGESRIALAIDAMRQGKVHIAPGYDGQYGKVRIFEKITPLDKKGQEVLF